MSVSMKRVFVRKLAVVAVSAGVVVSLAGCANGPLTFADCAPMYSSGTNTALVSTSGEFSADPEANFPTPIIATDVENSITIEGSGEKLDAGDIATLQITIYDAATGAQLISTGHDTAGLRVSVTEREPHFGDIAQCASVGSRIVTVGAAGDILGAENIAQNQLALAEDDAIVMVSDVESRYPGKADGVSQPAPSGFPAIVLAPNGQPGFTFPAGDAPSELQFAALKVGSGEALSSGDAAVMQVSGIEWGADSTFTNSWEESGVPGTFIVESTETSDGGLPPGLAEALIGQTVGSQVLVVLTPDVGFAPGTEPTGVTSGSTLVFVFDILGIQAQ
ncbi:FKBP-type peptidyl-prolyl cis-trans isomerase [Salinibacterium sp. SWN1162]|uniref:FKBP-type peptidyl-prolyl cis-trans isomerase n=1 Tax=Salinibacterium sp. SWN1162 TaxID=2792053 RepID=UPI001E560E34|nr:peptidylprolyl isomerase [Salinibacterium sp. SWN1162]